MKKILLTAAAALAITSGAGTIAATDANAGFHFKHHHHHKFHHQKFHHHKKYCVTKYKAVKVGFWTHHGYKFKIIYKPFHICH